MKVCHLTSVHQWNDIRIFHKECKSLSDAGFETHLIVPNTSNRIESTVHIHSFETENTGRLKRIRKTTKQVYQLALQIDADIYHFHDPELIPYGLKLRRKGKIVIYDSHEDLPKQVLSKFWIPKVFRLPLSWMVKKYEAYASKRLSAIISVNDQICERFKQTNNKVVKVANYPLLEELNSHTTDERPKKELQIVYVGSLTETRGITELVQAVEGTEIKLILAGNFSPQSYGDSLKQLKGWGNVDFRGFLNREQIAEVLLESSLGMVTLHPTPSYVEALPIKLFEYMSFGLPVVCSNFPIWKEIIDKYTVGVSVDPLNPEQIRQTLLNLLSEKSQMKEMGVNGINAIKKELNWSIEFIKLKDLYSNLLTTR